MKNYLLIRIIMLTGECSLLYLIFNLPNIELLQYILLFGIGILLLIISNTMMKKINKE